MHSQSTLSTPSFQSPPMELDAFPPSLPHGSGLADCPLSYVWQDMASGAPSSPAPSLSWSQSMSGYLASATPDACSSGPSSIRYGDISAAYQMLSPPASIEPSSAFLPTHISSPSPSPEDGHYMSTRSSFSSCESGSGFFSSAEPTEVSMPTGNRALLAGGSSAWSLDRMGQASLQTSTTPYQGTTSTTAMHEESPLMNVDGSYLHSHRNTHESEIPRSYSPALSTIGSERRVRRAGSLQRTVMTGAGLSSPRRRRQLTTSAEAKHQCQKCKKYFERTFNYKAHLATHDPERVYGHVCQFDSCDKKFVRRTDLKRHHQSVSYLHLTFPKFGSDR